MRSSARTGAVHVQQSLDRGARGDLDAAVEVDQLAVHARSGSRARCSPRPAGAAGRRTARPRRRRARPARRRRRSARRAPRTPPRRDLGVADAHLDRAEGEVRAHRPPDLRVLDDRVRARSSSRCSRVGRPGAVGVGDAAAREGLRERSACARSAGRASRPSRNGEFALTREQRRQDRAQPVADAHRAVGAADADVDVQRERVVAPRDVPQPLDDAAVVLGVDVALLAVVGPRVRAGRAERDRRARRRARTAAGAGRAGGRSRRAGPRRGPRRSRSPTGDQLAGDRRREHGSRGGRASRSSSKRGDEVERLAGRGSRTPPRGRR